MAGIGGTYTYCDECDLLHYAANCPSCEQKIEIAEFVAEVKDLKNHVDDLEEKIRAKGA